MNSDMTKGPVIPQLTEFTIPLVLGNLFQLTYNAADSFFVSGKEVEGFRPFDPASDI